EQAIATLLACAAEGLVGLESAPRIPDPEHHGGVLDIELDMRFVDAGVLGTVDQQFADGSKRHEPYAAGHGRWRMGDVQVDRLFELAAEVGGEPFQRRRQAEVLEDRRADLERQTADRGDGGFDLCRDVFEPDFVRVSLYEPAEVHLRSDE